MLINRVGTFFILIGIGLIALFILSDIAKTPSCSFFMAGAVSLGLGIYMWLRDPVQPGPPPDRFRLLKRMRNKGQNKK
jgi:hypothetical protein